MSAPSGTVWYPIELTDWLAGKFIRETKFKQQVFENLQFLGYTHVHDGTAGGGGVIAAADPKAIMFYSETGGSIP